MNAPTTSQTPTRVRVGTETIRLSESNLLGIGGEARVYAAGAGALKLYHEPPGPERIAKLLAFPSQLPDEVVGPKELAYAPGSGPASGAVVGFTMARVDKASPFRRLATRRGRQGLVTHQELTTLLKRTRSLISALHNRSIVIGDLNDGNLLLRGDRVWLIDADSIQFGGHACAVGHERFLDPRLYGRELGKEAYHSPESDWYAFAVLAFTSLLWVHPYGGVASGTRRTLLRRAEARHFVLSADVRYPGSAAPWKILPTDLIAWFHAVFERDLREPLPLQLLDLRWFRCGCGLVHARAHCPGCAETPSAPPPIERSRGRCVARTVLRTDGRILAATSRGGLRVLVCEDGLVRREDGRVVLRGEPAPGMGFGIASQRTFVGQRRSLICLGGPNVVEAPRRVDTYLGEPAFATNGHGAWLLDDGWLIDHGTGKRLGRALTDQTWIAVGEDMGLGMYRPGPNMTVFFVFLPGRPGLRELRLDAIEGTLTGIDASFGRGQALLELRTEVAGRDHVRLALITSDGRVLGGLAGSPDSHPALSSRGAKVVARGRVLCATDDGVLQLASEPGIGSLRAVRSFPDTTPFVTSESTLLEGPGGSVYVVDPRSATLLTTTPDPRS